MIICWWWRYKYKTNVTIKLFSNWLISPRNKDPRKVKLRISQILVVKVVEWYVCVHFSDLVLREGKNVGQFLPPANLIQQRFITDVLTWVTVQPTTLRDRVNLCPHMVWNNREQDRFSLSLSYSVTLHFCWLSSDVCDCSINTRYSVS